MGLPGTLLVFTAAALISWQAHALGPDAMAGKSAFAVCNACHDAQLDPPRGPPMFGVQRRYKRDHPQRDDFVRQVVAFVKQPGMEKVKMRGAVRHLGLMPAMPLPDDTLRAIAAYVYEEDFPPPCKHWEMASRRARQEGDENHARRDQEHFNRFCK